MTGRESVAVLVAHPDDETLWAGGTLLSETNWAPFVWCACRAARKAQHVRWPPDATTPVCRRTLSKRAASGARDLRLACLRGETRWHPRSLARRRRGFGPSP